MPDATELRVAAIVLAAGEARRFGGPKLAMPFGNATVIGCVVSAMQQAGAHPVVVVTAPEATAVAEALRDSCVEVVHNPDPTRGMLSSVQVGVGALPSEIDAFVLALGDQPRIRADGLGRLLHRLATTGKGIALPRHQGKRGHPVVFRARYREEILALGPDATLREVIHGNTDDLVEVDFEDDAFIHDIDTREEYEQERRRA